MRIKENYEINNEWDIVDVRRYTKKVCIKLGFDFMTQAYIVNFISELCQNMYTVAQSGMLSVEAVIEDKRRGIAIKAVDKGPGIAKMTDFLLENNMNEDSSDSRLNVSGMRRWFDEFEISSMEAGIKGLEITVVKWVTTGE